MSPRTVTPAEAQGMGHDEEAWRYEDSLCPGDSIVCAVYDDEHEGQIALVCGPLPSHAEAQRIADLIVSAPDLRATVASEPERIAAAVAAERAAIVATVEEMAVTWGALTPAEQALVERFAGHVARTLAAGRTP